MARKSARPAEVADALAVSRQKVETTCRRRALDYATEDHQGSLGPVDGAAVLADAEIYRAFLLGGDNDHEARTQALQFARRLDLETTKGFVDLAKKFLAYVEEGR